MMSPKGFFTGVLVGVGLTIASPAQAGWFGNSQGGAYFPQGAASFADTVISYTLGSGNVPLAYRGAFNALGVPNYAGVSSCSNQLSCTFCSLGDGGSLVLRFDDNRLTGSGDSSPDLYIFEVGPAVESTFVDISMDGVVWYSVGRIQGSTRAIDIDPFLISYGLTPAHQFAYVRITDDPAETAGTPAGADIDAVGAISSVLSSASVPEPGTLGLLGLGLVGLFLRLRRAQKM
ncbi:MAG: PEP-CTERM sorting domain-containing protein [Gemmataceae bacterium]|nr:PEP-CTERM sorting domain-containing protein [Gemmataceae bacterium]